MHGIPEDVASEREADVSPSEIKHCGHGRQFLLLFVRIATRKLTTICKRDIRIPFVATSEAALWQSASI